MGDSSVNIVTDATTAEDPGTGTDLIEVEVSRTAYLTKVVFTSDNEGQVDVRVRDQDGGNPDAKRLYDLTGSEDLQEEGSRENPVVKIPAGKEVALRTVDSFTGSISANLTLQELNQ